MTRKPDQPSLDEILDRIAVEETEPSYQALTHWTELYPEHSHALRDYFATWAVQEEEPLTQSLDLERFANRAVSHALNLLHHEQEANAAVAQETLSAVARHRGLDDAALAARTGLDESIVVKLSRRRIRFGTIPRLCIERLRAVLALTFDQICERLRGPPLAASAGARLKSKRKPMIRVETFGEALESSTLTDAEKESWRILIPDNGDIDA